MGVAPAPRRDELSLPKPDLNTILSSRDYRQDAAALVAVQTLANAKLQVDAYEQSKASKRDHNIRFSAVDFSGELLVTNPELFQPALCNGLGHAKAFGCGLLLVRRL